MSLKGKKLEFGSIEELLIQCWEENLIIGCDKLEPDESVHCYNGGFYYEDGCMIGSDVEATREFFEDTIYGEWANDASWHMVFQLDEEDRKKLAELHESCRGLTLGFDDKFKKYIQELEIKYHTTKDEA